MRKNKELPNNFLVTMVRQVTFKKSKIPTNIGKLVDWTEEPKNKHERKQQVEIMLKNLTEGAFTRANIGWRHRKNSNLKHELVYYINTKGQNIEAGKFTLRGYIKITKYNKTI